jgi:hypothetical protein
MFDKSQQVFLSICIIAQYTLFFGEASFTIVYLQVLTSFTLFHSSYPSSFVLIGISTGRHHSHQEGNADMDKLVTGCINNFSVSVQSGHGTWVEEHVQTTKWHSMKTGSALAAMPIVPLCTRVNFSLLGLTMVTALGCWSFEALTQRF